MYMMYGTRVESLFLTYIIVIYTCVFTLWIYAFSFSLSFHSTPVFFEFVALPLFKAWSKLFGSRFSVMLCKNVLNNKAYWDEQIPRNSSDSEDDN